MLSLSGSEMPSGHQSVDMLIKGRYFGSSRDGRNDDVDDDDNNNGDLRDAVDWPPLMKGEFTLSNKQCIIPTIIVIIIIS